MGGHVVDEGVGGDQAAAHAGVEVVVAHHQVAHGAVRDGVHHEAVGPGYGAGPDVPDRVAAISRHVDACPLATRTAHGPEVDHGVVHDTGVTTGGRRHGLVASDCAHLACRNGLRVVVGSVRTVERRCLDPAGERRGGGR